MKNALVFPVALLALGLANPAWADAGATRSLTANPAVPAGASVEVDNLVGRMTVTQGKSFRVVATVVADGRQAQALAQSVTLDVSTQGRVVDVHVRYPVGDHDRYRELASPHGSRFCFLAIFCADGHTSLEYQGKRVSVFHGGSEGVPLNVNVAVTVPAGIGAKFVNEAGLLEASGLADTLALESAGSDIRADKVSGDLTANTQGGDLHVQGLIGNLHAETGGGDAYLSRSSGDLHLRTSGGDAHADGVAGALVAATGGGDLRAQGIAGDLSAGTSGGDADIEGYAKGNRLSIRTDGGDLRLSGDLGATRAMDVGIGGGSAVLKLSDLSMHLDASSGGGDLSVHLPEATHVVSGDHAFSGDIGTPRGRGSVSSGGGDVTISG